MGVQQKSESAITVGAVDQFRLLADYSSRGMPGANKPDILAPGWVQLTGHDPITGTSFAAPFVTGVIACLLNDFDIDNILESIKATAIDLKQPRHYQGNGLISIENMIGVIRSEKNIGSNS